MMTYASEITPMKYRSRVVLMLGASFSLSNIIIPALAWLVLPRDWDWMLAENFGVYLLFICMIRINLFSFFQ